MLNQSTFFHSLYVDSVIHMSTWITPQDFILMFFGLTLGFFFGKTTNFYFLVVILCISSKKLGPLSWFLCVTSRLTFLNALTLRTQSVGFQPNSYSWLHILWERQICLSYFSQSYWTKSKCGSISHLSDRPLIYSFIEYRQTFFGKLSMSYITFSACGEARTSFLSSSWRDSSQ